MNQLSVEKRVQMLHCMVEGNSLRSTSRLCKCSITTVMKFLVEMGEVCHSIHDTMIRNVAAKRVQADEIWSFLYSKQRNVETNKNKVEWAGDVWTWIALDADSKLVISWVCGTRESYTAQYFMNDLAMRVKDRIQLTTDGYVPYVDCVNVSFGNNIDYARYIKMFGKQPKSTKDRDPDKVITTRRYSPRELTMIEIRNVCGSPDPDYISTSYVERVNLSLRQGLRRFTRLTNGYSKKYVNHVYAQAIHFCYYNMCQKHSTIKTTPAVKAGITDRIWTLEDLVNTLISQENYERMEKYGWAC